MRRKRKRTCGLRKKHLQRSWFFFSYRLGIPSFKKNEVISRCFSRILVAPSVGSFTDSHFENFVKHLLWHQNYFGMDYSPQYLDLRHPIMPYPPIYINFFSTPLPIIQYFEDSIPPIYKGGVQTMMVFSLFMRHSHFWHAKNTQQKTKINTIPLFPLCIRVYKLLDEKSVSQYIFHISRGAFHVTQVTLQNKKMRKKQNLFVHEKKI